MNLDPLDDALQNLAAAVLRLHEARQAMAVDKPAQQMRCLHPTLSFDDPGVRCLTCGKTFGPQIAQPTQEEYEEKLRCKLEEDRLEQRAVLRGPPGGLRGPDEPNPVVAGVGPSDNFRPSRRCPMTLDGKHVVCQRQDGSYFCDRCATGLFKE